MMESRHKISQIGLVCRLKSVPRPPATVSHFLTCWEFRLAIPRLRLTDAEKVTAILRFFAIGETVDDFVVLCLRSITPFKGK